MSVYNRKSWVHNGTKHWIHNGRHYHKRLGFFGTKKKFRKPSKNKFNYKRYISKQGEKDEFKRFSEMVRKGEIDSFDFNGENWNAYNLGYKKKDSLEKYTHTWNGKTDDDFLNEIYQANEDFENELFVDSKIADLDGY